jgi:hypothetical protein
MTGSKGHRIELQGLHHSASTAEAAAVVAGLERFMRETVPATADREGAPDRWHEAALLEGVNREPQIDVPHSWINP